MKNYVVKANIKLEARARNEDEAKKKVIEDLSDFLRHHSFADLLEVREKEVEKHERRIVKRD